MITEKELEKLIEQEATIYAIDDDGELLKIKTKFIHHPKKVEDGTILDNIYNVCYEKDGGICVYEVSSHYEDLYKTKDEAEFAMEFGNITRTETLKLPTWKELKRKLKKDKHNDIDFYDQKHNKHSIWISESQVCVVDFWEDGSYGGTDELLTKENYIEVCRVAKDLFLGKEPKE